MILRHRAALNFSPQRLPSLPEAVSDRRCFSNRCSLRRSHERLNDELLLLNVARVADDQSVHFTSTSSIAATSIGPRRSASAVRYIRKRLDQASTLQYWWSSSENPTFSIVPLSGEDFTKRIATHSG